MTMGILVFLTVCVIVICVLIIAAILLQEDKSGGGMGIIGGSSQSFFGVSSGSMLAKITSVLLTILIVTGILIAILCSRSAEPIIDTSDINKAEMSLDEIKINKNTDVKFQDASADIK